MDELTFDQYPVIDQPYYSLEWFKQCARAVLSLEVRRSWFANADDIAAALIRRSGEAHAGVGKGMAAFFMPQEALDDDELLRGAAMEKQISYMEMVQQEQAEKMPQTIHPVDLALFCELMYIPYLPEVKTETESAEATRPSPGKKRGRGAKKPRSDERS